MKNILLIPSKNKDKKGKKNMKNTTYDEYSNEGIYADDGFTDEEIKMICWYEDKNKRFDANILNFLFGSSYVFYNHGEYQIEIHSLLGKVVLPARYEALTYDRETAKHTYDVALALKAKIEKNLSEKWAVIYDKLKSYNRLAFDRCIEFEEYIPTYIDDVVQYKEIMAAIKEAVSGIDYEVKSEKSGEIITAAFDFRRVCLSIFDGLKIKYTLWFTDELENDIPFLNDEYLI